MKNSAPDMPEKCKHKDCLKGYKCKLFARPGDVNYKLCKKCIENNQMCDECDTEPTPPEIPDSSKKCVCETGFWDSALSCPCGKSGPTSSEKPNSSNIKVSDSKNYSFTSKSVKRPSKEEYFNQLPPKEQEEILKLRKVAEQLNSSKLEEAKRMIEGWKNHMLFSHSVDCPDRSVCCLSALELQAFVLFLLGQQDLLSYERGREDQKKIDYIVMEDALSYMQSFNGRTIAECIEVAEKDNLNPKAQQALSDNKNKV